MINPNPYGYAGPHYMPTDPLDDAHLRAFFDQHGVTQRFDPLATPELTLPARPIDLSASLPVAPSRRVRIEAAQVVDDARDLAYHLATATARAVDLTHAVLLTAAALGRLAWWRATHQS